LMAEFNVSPIAALANARRARAYIKYPFLKTWISDLCLARSATRKSTWVSGTARWLTKYGPEGMYDYLSDEKARIKRNSPHPMLPSLPDSTDDEEIPEMTIDLVSKYATKVGQMTELCVRDRWRLNRATPHFKWYSAAILPVAVHRDWFLISRAIPELCIAMSYLASARSGATLTGYSMACMNIIDAKYKKLCPFCLKSDADTVTHMLVACDAWSEERELHMGKLIKEIRDILTDSPAGSSDNGVSTLLLGGMMPGHTNNRPYLFKGFCPGRKTFVYLKSDEELRNPSGNTSPMRGEPIEDVGASMNLTNREDVWCWDTNGDAVCVPDVAGHKRNLRREKVARTKLATAEKRARDSRKEKKIRKCGAARVGMFFESIMRQRKVTLDVLGGRVKYTSTMQVSME
jgi:hypothetical protein